MKRIFCTILFLPLAYNIASAQFIKADLQVAGLTCSLCSKSTDNELKKLDFIDSIHIDLSHATFTLYFKKDKPVNFYQIKKKVEDAGFSVVMLQAEGKFDNLPIDTDSHFNYQNATFYCLSKAPQTLSGKIMFQLVDKGFVSKKEYKKYAQQCAARHNSQGKDPVYHVIFQIEKWK